MLQVENISFSYGRRKPEVLSDFSFSLEKGRVYGLLGKNGVGKSTLLYLMCGLLTPKHGRVMYHGVDMRRRLPETLRDVFLVPEEFDLPAVSLVQFVELNSPFYPNFSKEDMMTYLHLFEMDWNIHLGGLSMGQKKKVFMSFALATHTSLLLMDEPTNGLDIMAKKVFMSFALATHTSLLLMDEPTNGLDIMAKSQFRKFIASGMSDERTIVISTHQVRDIDNVLDHVVIMNNSCVLLDESIVRVTERLAFVESDSPALAEEALYKLPSVQGNSLLLPNREGVETKLNLELLFGAVLANPEKIKDLFHSKVEEER